MKLEARNMSQIHAMRTSPPRWFDKDKNKRQKRDRSERQLFKIDKCSKLFKTETNGSRDMGRQRQKETKSIRDKAKIERETNRDNAKRDKETRPRQIETKRTKDTKTKKMAKFISKI